ncbi:MAG: hypothetical protein ACC657_09265 [Thiohalomonadales bacterium]
MPMIINKQQKLGHGIGIPLSRPCAAGRGTRACHGWQCFACLDRGIPVSWPDLNYKSDKI